MQFWKPRLRASAIHLAISLSIATLAAWLVFGWWFRTRPRAVGRA